MISILKILAADPQEQLNALNKTTKLDTNLIDLIGTIINTAVGLVGIIATIMLIIGGFRYATSAGNEKAVTAAKNQIMYAIIGIIIVLISFAVTGFVLGALK